MVTNKNTEQKKRVRNKSLNKVWPGVTPKRNDREPRSGKKRPDTSSSSSDSEER